MKDEFYRPSPADVAPQSADNSRAAARSPSPQQKPSASSLRSGQDRNRPTGIIQPWWTQALRGRSPVSTFRSPSTPNGTGR
jgi:hypothetical protein